MYIPISQLSHLNGTNEEYCALSHDKNKAMKERGEIETRVRQLTSNVQYLENIRMSGRTRSFREDQRIESGCPQESEGSSAQMHRNKTRLGSEIQGVRGEESLPELQRNLDTARENLADKYQEITDITTKMQLAPEDKEQLSALDDRLNHFFYDSKVTRNKSVAIEKALSNETSSSLFTRPEYRVASSDVFSSKGYSAVGKNMVRYGNKIYEKLDTCMGWAHFGLTLLAPIAHTILAIANLAYRILSVVLLLPLWTQSGDITAEYNGAERWKALGKDFLRILSAPFVPAVITWTHLIGMVRHQDGARLCAAVENAFYGGDVTLAPCFHPIFSIESSPTSA